MTTDELILKELKKLNKLMEMLVCAQKIKAANDDRVKRSGSGQYAGSDMDREAGCSVVLVRTTTSDSLPGGTHS